MGARTTNAGMKRCVWIRNRSSTCSFESIMGPLCFPYLHQPRLLALSWEHFAFLTCTMQPRLLALSWDHFAFLTCTNHAYWHYCTQETFNSLIPRHMWHGSSHTQGLLFVLIGPQHHPHLSVDHSGWVMLANCDDILNRQQFGTHMHCNSEQVYYSMQALTACNTVEYTIGNSSSDVIENSSDAIENFTMAMSERSH